ncbi:hypothetical protein C7974DRAFT_396985 [Boeremia exigua]|uniref:uncharacterized protein n=1 Tax=Boeremia exigua TaxID=749465 RepID=UPI001E8E1969|nr:uncharacterized protein C7974DRAFT_396985 [Boeremia exigua]KAH6621694.1 hypothetical protein C7974DRAFT_396985 [Boeremia exigua]
MARLKKGKVGASVARATPYPASKPPKNTANKENASPQDSASPAATPPLTAEDKPALKSNPAAKSEPAAKKDAALMKVTAASAHPDLPDSYLDIELEEAIGFFGDIEVPCYENAATVRRKLNTLVGSKVQIPGTNKVFNKTNLSNALCEIAQEHPLIIPSSAGTRSEGPSVRALTTFLKKSGNMAGGDSQTFYYGTMLLEKLRIWNGEKKSKAREKAEDEFPSGRRRIDPATARLICSVKDVPTRAEMANFRR